MNIDRNNSNNSLWSASTDFSERESSLHAEGEEVCDDVSEPWETGFETCSGGSFSLEEGLLKDFEDDSKSIGEPDREELDCEDDSDCLNGYEGNSEEGIATDRNGVDPRGPGSTI